MVPGLVVGALPAAIAAVEAALFRVVLIVAERISSPIGTGAKRGAAHIIIIIIIIIIMEFILDFGFLVVGEVDGLHAVLAALLHGLQLVLGLEVCHAAGGPQVFGVAVVHDAVAAKVLVVGREVVPHAHVVADFVGHDFAGGRVGLPATRLSIPSQCSHCQFPN